MYEVRERTRGCEKMVEGEEDEDEEWEGGKVTQVDDSSESDSDDEAFYALVERVKAVEVVANSGTGSTASKVGEGEEEGGGVKAAAKRKRDGSGRMPAPLGKDKRGMIIRTCCVDGYTYKTGYMGHMAQHKAVKHNIEYVRKIPNDRKERDKQGNIIKVCAV